MFDPRTVAQERRLNGKQKMVVVIMDLLLLAELTYCIYAGHHNPHDMTAFFLRTFVPAAVATVVGARFLMRRLDSEHPEDPAPNEHEVNDP
jgi:hypothetical protein